ncbi:YkgJ family cysteine cluster protein [Bacillus sp. FSL W7-1360]
MKRKKYSPKDPCFCGSGRKIKKCHSDVHPDSRAAHLLRNYLSLDKKKEEYRTKIEQNSPCQKGCFICCHDDFAISEVEFEWIMRAMKKWPAEKVERVYDIALQQCQHVMEYSPDVWSRLEGDANTDVEVLEKDAYYYANSRKRNVFPCPLLDVENQSCSVYKERPFICRTHGSFHYGEAENGKRYICDFITVNGRFIETHPDAIEENINIERISNLEDPYTKEVHSRRPYPIFYWFYLFYKQTGKKIARYNHDKPLNFDRAIEELNGRIFLDARIDRLLGNLGKR